MKKKYERKDDDKSAQMDLLYVHFPAFIDRLVERLAALEHDQWMNWAKALLQQESLSSERRKRWAEIMVPYTDLPEELKEDDRKLARKVVGEIVTELGLK